MPRLFFALYPDETVRNHLKRLSGNISAGRLVKPDNLHVTLHFIGNTDAQNCLIAQAGHIQFEPFTLMIDQYGYFKRAKVFWAGPSVFPERLSRLAHDCASATIACGIDANENNFVPHVTLARKISSHPDLSTFEAIEWFVEHFCLMASRPGRHGVDYTVVKTFTFRSSSHTG